MVKNILGIIAIVVFVAGFVYGSYWLAKTVSYTLFYKSMVEETVREMIKPGYLQ